MTSDTSPSDAPQSGRVGIFDLLRGFSVVSMVLFHLCYDLKFLGGVELAWFEPPLQDIWRCSISWTFLAIAGCMFTFSRSNLRRALQYGGVALAIWVVTSVASVDTPISFGIIYCMAACTLVTELLRRLGVTPRGYAAAGALFVAFLALQGLSDGTVLFGTVVMPSEAYRSELLSWLGLPGPGFSSGDYYPLLPYLLVYLLGVALGNAWRSRGYPEWARNAHFAPLSFVGRHALAIYVLHQPLLLVLCGLLA
ncbi:heparan-alpha-glucosaminide N-acetyltransferase [Thermophilibacter provencensis]|uniref:Heparan-alpha-glucosaminide N-acetyltransferase n=1 Tax=Thermophilibacter provencensis TaxID=1852386 RepID=A0ABT7V337_9ACTN|nr:heparan-alpha-glucosaminide N-acetyltransferase [Thermophilibacter provencensis]MDM8271009.1 heparan-alpha-glucosaminide N-acetyltransferase [Thermophilibacter provencensis]